MITIKYGYLYNWYAVTNVKELTSSVAWRVPTMSDFTGLTAAVTIPMYSNFGGGVLKSIITTPSNHPRWDSPNLNATNSVNFNLYGAGYVTSGGTFDWLGEWGNLWSVDESVNPTYPAAAFAQGITVGSNSNNIGTFTYLKSNGHAIRICRDATVTEQVHADGTMLADYVGNNGQSYKTVKIGLLVWTAESLIETKYRDTSIISNITIAIDWADDIIGAYTSYDNNNYYAWEMAVPSPPNINHYFSVIQSWL